MFLDKNIHVFEKRISEHKPVIIPGKYLIRRACTTVLLYKSPFEDEIYMLLIKRAKRKGDPWSGHVSLPGGMMDNKDKNGLSTATRELLEETGIDIEQEGKHIGRLSDLFTRSHNNIAPMIVTPFIFLMNNYDSIKFKKEDEVEEIFKLPLSFLLKKENRKKMKYRVMGKNFNIPCYFYEKRRIWGLTLMMLDELIDIYLKKKQTHFKWFSRFVAFD